MLFLGCIVLFISIISIGETTTSSNFLNCRGEDREEGEDDACAHAKIEQVFIGMVYLICFYIELSIETSFNLNIEGVCGRYRSLVMISMFEIVGAVLIYFIIEKLFILYISNIYLKHIKNVCFSVYHQF